jgi:hypothetical protein
MMSALWGLGETCDLPAAAVISDKANMKSFFIRVGFIAP